MNDIHYFPTLPSTNETARAAAVDGAPAFYTVAAERQTAGKGRLGRSFASPPGGAYFSVVLRPCLTQADYGRITPFSALAVRRAIQETAKLSTDIKWVNDLLYRGKKVCGILTESGVDRNGSPFIIVGIGINTGNGTLPPELSDVAGHIPYDDNKTLIAAVVRQFRQGAAQMESGAFLPEYRSACTSLGREVILFDDHHSEKVFAVDIAENGGLVVRHTDGRLRTVSGGEISLRPAPTDMN